MVSGFDERLIALIVSHPSIIVGTCDRALVPTLTRGFGARVIDGGAAVDILISSWPGRPTRGNIESTGRVAATFTAPETFESYQIKGHAAEVADCAPDDHALEADFTRTIRARIASLGEAPNVVEATFSARGLFRVRVVPEAVFLQTPGKDAGRRL